MDVLFILAPLAALLWILPQSQAWGRLWGRLFVGTVFAQAVQVLTLRLGFNLATGLPQLNAAGLLQPLLGIHSATFPTGDPVQLGPDEQVAAATLRLRAGDHLPLHTFDDRELDAHGDSVQVDPLLGILGALADMPRVGVP